MEQEPKLQAVEIECDYLDGKMYMRVYNKRSEMLVPFVENHRYFDKWLEWWTEPNIFDLQNKQK